MTELGGKEISSSSCGRCPVCSKQNEHSPAGGPSGPKLVLCALLVFIAPLIAAVVAADVVQNRYHSSNTLTALSGVAAGLLTILLVKLLTRRIGTETEITSLHACPKTLK